jgi:hypothetical protein
MAVSSDGRRCAVLWQESSYADSKFKYLRKLVRVFEVPPDMDSQGVVQPVAEFEL